MSVASVEDRLVKPLEIAAQHAAAVDRDGRFPQEAIDALADAGLFGLTIPETQGGLGDGPLEFLAATRRIAAVDPSAAMIYLMHTCAVQVSIAGGAPDAVVSGMARSELSTLAFSERGSRSHFWAPVSQIESANGDARLAASKSFVTSAGHANTYVASTRPSGTESPIESTLYLVQASASGIEMTGPWIGLGLRGNASSPMTFSAVAAAFAGTRAVYAVSSRSVLALTDPPQPSMSSERPPASGKFAVPLKTRCSSRWDRPAEASSSWRDPTPTNKAAETERACGISCVTTRSPLSSTLRTNGSSPLARRGIERTVT